MLRLEGACAELLTSTACRSWEPEEQGARCEKDHNICGMVHFCRENPDFRYFGKRKRLNERSIMVWFLLKYSNIQKIRRPISSVRALNLVTEAHHVGMVVNHSKVYFGHDLGIEIMDDITESEDVQEEQVGDECMPGPEVMHPYAAPIH